MQCVQILLYIIVEKYQTLLNVIKVKDISLVQVRLQPLTTNNKVH